MPIDNKAKLREFMAEQMPEILRNHPEVLFQALAADQEAFANAMRSAGFAEVERRLIGTEDVVAAHRLAGDHNVIDVGRGARIRGQCAFRTYRDPRDGSTRRTYLTNREQETLAQEWLEAFYQPNQVHPDSGRNLHVIRAELEKHVRAPADPLTADVGSAAGALVPTIIQAEVFEIMNERFVLKGKIQMYQSAAPIQINRRTVKIQVFRGGAATDIAEDKPEVGPVRLSPQRVAVITYVDIQLAAASPVGPVRWVLEQMAEAIAKDDQRVIILGQPGNNEPRGIASQPTSGSNAWELMNTQAYDNTNRQTERDSMKAAYYAVPQRHRQSRSFCWVGNDDFVREMHTHNDQDDKPFEPAREGGMERYLNKDLVESLEITTGAGPATTGYGGDFDLYGWVENPEGLRLETTREGGEAWQSDSIGVKAVQRVDGAPIVGPAFVEITSVDV